MALCWRSTRGQRSAGAAVALGGRDNRQGRTGWRGHKEIRSWRAEEAPGSGARVAQPLSSSAPPPYPIVLGWARCAPASANQSRAPFSRVVGQRGSQGGGLFLGAVEALFSTPRTPLAARTGRSPFPMTRPRRGLPATTPRMGGGVELGGPPLHQAAPTVTAASQPFSARVIEHECGSSKSMGRIGNGHGRRATHRSGRNAAPSSPPSDSERSAMVQCKNSPPRARISMYLVILVLSTAHGKETENEATSMISAGWH